VEGWGDGWGRRTREVLCIKVLEFFLDRVWVIGKGDGRVIAPYLKHEIKTSDSDTCWWCEKDIRQTRDHLFKDCIYWKEDIKMFWRKVAKDVGPRWRRYRWKQISELFDEDKATEAILWFLDRTGVGKKPRERPLAEYEGDEPEIM
jgi:hypothetical protein